jgi:excisionase family DNA binding protein
MGEQLLDPGDVAEILQVSKASAYRMLKQGELPTIRIDSLVRVRKPDLDQFICEIRDQSISNALPKA